MVKEALRRLPGERLIYVGDTARVPYGTKSPDTIRRYALQISFFLMQHPVKAIVVACNTVSAVALRALRTLPIPIVGVIDPGAQAAVVKTRSYRIGVIGTPATVASHAYKKAIQRLSPRARVWETACPLFVPLAEEGWFNHGLTHHVALTYLRPLLKNRIDTLVLGCTHYPLLKETLRAVVGPKVQLIDSAEEVAKDLERVLEKADLKNGERHAGAAQYYVTDHPAAFARLGARFLGRPISPARRLLLENL